MLVYFNLLGYIFQSHNLHQSNLSIQSFNSEYNCFFEFIIISIIVLQNWSMLMTIYLQRHFTSRIQRFFFLLHESKTIIALIENNYYNFFLLIQSNPAHCLSFSRNKTTRLIDHSFFNLIHTHTNSHIQCITEACMMKWQSYLINQLDLTKSVSEPSFIHVDTCHCKVSEEKLFDITSGTHRLRFDSCCVYLSLVGFLYMTFAVYFKFSSIWKTNLVLKPQFKVSCYFLKHGFIFIDYLVHLMHLLG